MATNPKKNKKIYWILGGVVVLLLAAVWIKGGSRPDALEVSFDKVERRTIQERVSASGRIYPRTEVKVSSDVSGEVIELLVEEGDTVREGQLLAKIDPDAYTSAVERGEASVLTAKAQAANATAGISQAKSQKEQIEAQLANQTELHKRNEKLYKEKVISAVEFEQSLATLKGLEANLRAAKASVDAASEMAKGATFSVRSAEASLKELKTNLNRTSITSPMNGIVSLLNVKQGERVVGTIQMAGTEIMRIADYSEIEVQVDVSENDILRIAQNDEAEIEVDAYLDRKFKGRVIQIANTASAAGGLGAALSADQATNFLVRILIDPTSYADIREKTGREPFRPGMSATVDILTNQVSDVLCVPIQAVTTREEKVKSIVDQEKNPEKEKKAANDPIREIVFVVTRDTVAVREVKSGIQDDTYIEIKSGLEEGEQIVSGPYSAVSRKLESGKAVTEQKSKSTSKDKDEDKD
jgi:HlyD family secretion protein